MWGFRVLFRIKGFELGLSTVNAESKAVSSH